MLRGYPVIPPLLLRSVGRSDVRVGREAQKWTNGCNFPRILTILSRHSKFFRQTINFDLLN